MTLPGSFLDSSATAGSALALGNISGDIVVPGCWVGRRRESGITDDNGLLLAVCAKLSAEMNNIIMAIKFFMVCYFTLTSTLIFPVSVPE
jgi:hypothetical protein